MVNKIIWSITTILVLVSAGAGVFYPNIYNGVIAKEFIPGAVPQDLLTIIICIWLLRIIYHLKETNIKSQVVIMGMIGSFFYLYGIFTIERVYNLMYLFYAAIFGMSFWSILYSLMNIDNEVIRKIKTSPVIFNISAMFGIIIDVLFTGLWISALIPLMINHNRIEYLYSIYILDLCFIMPAFLITSILSLRKNILGILFLPAVFIIGFFVIFPLGLGEMARPFYGQAVNYGAMTMSFGFSILMLTVGALHLKAIST